MNTIINTALFVFIVGATAWVGPALDEIDAKTQDAQQRIKHQQAEERRDRAAREICGENAGFSFDVSVLTCFSKKGKKLRKVEI